MHSMSKTLATFEQEQMLLSEGFSFIFGIDEAGRGPLAGPVVAGVATIKDFAQLDLTDKRWNFVRDSKTLSEKQRELMFDFVSEHFHVGVGICDHKTIDRMNILEASFLAMKKAILQLKGEIKKNAEISFGAKNFSDSDLVILVDGNKTIPHLSLRQLAIVGGDKLVRSIAAASIVAKVTRDRIIREADKLYPQYGFAKHKGYGTKAHLEALKQHGPCPIHRLSFAPLKKEKVESQDYY